AQPSCRPDENWEEWATASSLQRIRDERRAGLQAWQQRLAASGMPNVRALAQRIERAGALGILMSEWSQGWGVQKVFDAVTDSVPTIDLGCEDYGLVFRLASRGQGPVLRVDAQAEFLGEVPVANTIGEIRGT